MDFAKTSDGDIIRLSKKRLNRHGLICGSTGGGKTVTLQKLAELMCDEGINVIIPDIKGDLNGFDAEGGNITSISAEIHRLGETMETYCRGYDYTLISLDDSLNNGLGAINPHTMELEGGVDPLVIARIMRLNPTQTELLSLSINEAVSLGFKDMRGYYGFLRALQKGELETKLKYFDKRTIGVVMRKIDVLFQSKLGRLFKRRGSGGKLLDTLSCPQIASISCDRLICDPVAYSSFLLMLMDEIYNAMSEIGDTDKPKVCIILDEAHLIFKYGDSYSRSTASSKVAFMVKAARSRGIGLFFVTQDPRDIDKPVLDQLGLRVQHSMRAGSDPSILRKIAEGFYTKDKYTLAGEIIKLKIGEAIISIINDDGQSDPAVKAKILPPRSYVGGIGKPKDSELAVVSRYSPVIKQQQKHNEGSTCTAFAIFAIIILGILMLFSLLIVFCLV